MQYVTYVVEIFFMKYRVLAWNIPKNLNLYKIMSSYKKKMKPS